MKRQTNNAEELKAAVKTGWASITPQQAPRLRASRLNRPAAATLTDIHVHIFPTSFLGD